MLGREPHRYKVQMQRLGDGQTVEQDYAVHWSPDKVESSEVAIACAAEATVKHGFDEMHQPRNKHLGLSAILQKPVTLKSSK